MSDGHQPSISILGAPSRTIRQARASERISLENYERIVRFYLQLLENRGK